MLDDELLVVLGLLEDAPDRLGATLLWDVRNEDIEWTTLAYIERNEFAWFSIDDLNEISGAPCTFTRTQELIPGRPARRDFWR